MLRNAFRTYERYPALPTFQRASLANSCLNSTTAFRSDLHRTEKRPPFQQKRYFPTDTIQNGSKQWRNDAITAMSCSKRIQETLRSCPALHDILPYDVTICIGRGEESASQTFGAHKLILALFSERFRRMWSSSLQREPHQPENVIHFVDIEPHAFANMLGYMYADDRSGLTMDNIMDSLFCASYFQVGRLVEICRDFIEINLAAGHACHVFRRARLMGDERMAQLALSMICRSPHDALASPEFLQLSAADLKAILDRDDLNMPEPNVYQLVQRWALNRTSGSNGKTKVRDAIGDLKFSIRFPLFDQETLPNGPVKDGVVTLGELDQSASSINDASVLFKSTPRQPAPAPLYISFQIGCDAFHDDQDASLTGRVVIKVFPEFAPESCAYLRTLVNGYGPRLVLCKQFNMDPQYFHHKISPDPPETLIHASSILSRTVPGAVCFGWEGNHLPDPVLGHREYEGGPVYSVCLASEQPDGGAVFGRIVHGMELLQSAWQHFLAGDLANSGIFYYTDNWCRHGKFPARLEPSKGWMGLRIRDGSEEESDDEEEESDDGEEESDDEEEELHSQEDNIEGKDTKGSTN